jgi:hypothetical protein
LSGAPSHPHHVEIESPEEWTMSVRAKFYIRSVTAIAGGDTDTGSVELQPVSRGAANAAWSSATPSGLITLTTTNPNAWRWYRDRLGREVYVDFTDPPEGALDPAAHAFVASGIPEGNYGHTLCQSCGQPEDAHVPTD